MFSPFVHKPSSSSEYYFNVPIDNPMIFDSIVHLGYKDNIPDVFGGNVDNFLSL